MKIKSYEAVNVEIECRLCEAKFVRSKRTQIYCSHSCRANAYRQRLAWRDSNDSDDEHVTLDDIGRMLHATQLAINVLIDDDGTLLAANLPEVAAIRESCLLILDATKPLQEPIAQ